MILIALFAILNQAKASADKRTVFISYTTDDSIDFAAPEVRVKLEARSRSPLCKYYYPNPFTILAIGQRTKEFGGVDIYKGIDPESGLKMYALEINYKAPRGCKFDLEEVWITHTTSIDYPTPGFRRLNEKTKIHFTVNVLGKEFEDSSAFQRGVLDFDADGKTIFGNPRAQCFLEKYVNDWPNDPDKYYYLRPRCSAVNDQSHGHFGSSMAFYFTQTFYENHFANPANNNQLLAPAFHFTAELEKQ